MVVVLDGGSLPYTVLSHTADTGIEATADTFPELLRDLAAGMFGLMGSPEPGATDRLVEVGVESASHEDLVVDVLSELLYHSEVEDLFLCWFEVRATGPSSVHVTASGVANAGVELTGAPIKAVTYHDVAVSETEEGWYGRVYFDV
jgi:SHS2 domain-containing protein